VADINENSDEDDEDDTGNPSQQAINALMQHKLAGLIGKSSGYIESLPVPIKRRVEGLKGIGTEYDKLVKEHKKEMYELEKKVRFKKKFPPFPFPCV
jgi:nucleosome assembly protein 1-like 1